MKPYNASIGVLVDPSTRELYNQKTAEPFFSLLFKELISLNTEVKEGNTLTNKTIFFLLNEKHITGSTKKSAHIKRSQNKNIRKSQTNKKKAVQLFRIRNKG